MKEKVWLILLLLLLLELSYAASSSSGRPFHTTLHSMVASSSNGNATYINSMTVDEQLYSRQLLVYGKSAQKRMQDAHVLVIGDSPLTAEIVKNLALAGLGRISISGSDGSSVGKEGYARQPSARDKDIMGDLNGDITGAVIKDKENMKIDERHKSESRLLGDVVDLVSYARGLNPYVTASHADISKRPHQHNEEDKDNVNDYTVIIVVDSLFESSFDLHRAYPGITKKAKLISCGVQGVCGYILNDFGEHYIEDADGEDVKVRYDVFPEYTNI